MPRKHDHNRLMKARQMLTGATVKAVQFMPQEIVDEIQWTHDKLPIEIHFDNGLKLIASRDEECNGPGTYLIEGDTLAII